MHPCLMFPARSLILLLHALSLVSGNPEAMAWNPEAVVSLMLALLSLVLLTLGTHVLEFHMKWELFHRGHITLISELSLLY